MNHLNEDFYKRLAIVEENCRRLKNIEEISGQNKDTVLKIVRILEGSQVNGTRIRGVIERLDELEGFKNAFVKVSLWIIGVIIAPLLALFGFLGVKILAHINEIMFFLDKIEQMK